MEILHLMGAPFAVSVVLVLIHAYLGGHVLRRGVIFVGILADPLEIRDGHAVVPERPGNGMRWNEDAVARFLVR